MKFQTEIIRNVKEKRELQNLDDAFVAQKIKKHLLTKPKLFKKLEEAKNFKQFSKSKEFTAMKKEVRKTLRESYGVFDLDEKGERDKLLEQLRHAPNNLDLIRDILALHKSTNERVLYYNIFFTRLFDIIEKPKSILDIGCGLNPVSYPLLAEQSGTKPRYSACDIATTDIEFLKEFYKVQKIKGELFTCDAVKEQELLLKKARTLQPDMIFMLKVVDTLETIERHCTKKLIPELAKHTKWLVISFSTVSIGGNKAINDERRAWFEHFLEKAGLEYQTTSVPNEKFYSIKC